MSISLLGIIHLRRAIFECLFQLTLSLPCTPTSFSACSRRPQINLSQRVLACDRAGRVLFTPVLSSLLFLSCSRHLVVVIHVDHSAALHHRLERKDAQAGALSRHDASELPRRMVRPQPAHSNDDLQSHPVPDQRLSLDGRAAQAALRQSRLRLPAREHVTMFAVPRKVPVQPTSVDTEFHVHALIPRYDRARVESIEHPALAHVRRLDAHERNEPIVGRLSSPVVEHLVVVVVPPFSSRFLVLSTRVHLSHRHALLSDLLLRTCSIDLHCHELLAGTIERLAAAAPTEQQPARHDHRESPGDHHDNLGAVDDDRTAEHEHRPIPARQRHDRQTRTQWSDARTVRDAFATHCQSHGRTRGVDGVLALVSNHASLTADGRQTKVLCQSSVREQSDSLLAIDFSSACCSTCLLLFFR